MTENEAARHVLDAAFVVHSNLGPGLLESVYEVVLAHELRKRGVRVERQKPIVIQYDGLIFEEGFRADLVVETHLKNGRKRVINGEIEPEGVSF